MLTDLSIKKLPLPEKRREVPDGRVTGLYLVLQPSGARSWALRYRVAGKSTKLTFGIYPTIDLATARRRAQEALGDVAAGKDPAAAKQSSKVAARAARIAQDDRVERVAERFIERYVKRSGKVGEGWGAEIGRLFKIEILPRIGDKHIDGVTKNDVLAILDAIVDRGSPITANRTLAVLRKFFNWARDDRGLIATSPCQGVAAPAAERSRDHVLSDGEIRLAWRAFEIVGWPFGPIAQLLLLTGARRDEIASAQWAELELDANIWTIAKERSKNGVAHEIPLSGAALRILEALPRIEAGSRPASFVFTTNGRTPPSGFSKARARINAAILEEATATGQEPLTPWTLHDLRRTAASGMAGLGIAPHVVEAVLNHRSGTIKGVAKVYNRYNYATEKRAALEQWARRLAAIVGGKAEDNVVPIRSRSETR